MIRRQSTTSWLLAGLACAGALWLAAVTRPNLRPVLRDPGHVAYHGGADPWKNVYTPAYHALHDSGWIRTDAFNYPLGEHIVFADGQPLLSAAMRVARVREVPTAVAWVQLAPWVGALAGAMLLALLLARLGLPVGLATATGLGITMLSPQLQRASGHFALSYVFVLPALMHVLLSWTHAPRWRWIALTAALVVACGQLHLYHVALGLALAGLYLGYALWRGGVAPRGRIVAQGLALLLVVYACTHLLVVVPWDVADRPPTPNGLLYAVARWEDVFINRDLAWWRWFHGHVTHIRGPGSLEGYGYVGIFGGVFAVGAVLALLVRAARWVLARVRARRRGPHRDLAAAVGLPDADSPLGPPRHWLWGSELPARERYFLGGVLCAGVATALLAHGLPFVIPAIGDLGEWTGPLRQFRALGRFIWVGYYALLLAAYTWAYYRFWRKPDLRWLPFGLTCILLLEGLSNLRRIETNPFALPWGERMERWVAGTGAPVGYQAVLPVPYFHEGGETFPAPLGQADFAVSTQVSLATGLPSLGVAMSRQGNEATFDRLPLDHVWTDVPPVLRAIEGRGDVLVTVSRQQLQTTIETRGYDPYAAWLAECDTLLVDDNYVFLRLSTTPASLERLVGVACQAARARVTDVDTAGATLRPGFDYHPGPAVVSATDAYDESGWYEVARWPTPDTAALAVSWVAEVEGVRRPFQDFRLERRLLADDRQVFAAELPAVTWTTALQAEGATVRAEVTGAPGPSELRLRARLRAPLTVADTLRVRHVTMHPVGRVWGLRLADGSWLVDGLRFVGCTGED